MEDEFFLDRPKTRVQWLLGNNCNYSCSYCADIFRKGDKPFPNEELIVEVCMDLIAHYDMLERDVVFEFIGGEPTMAGNLYEVGVRLHNHPVNFVLKTNGSADIEWWKNSKKYISDVIISVHKEFCSLPHIEQVIELLQDNEIGNPTNVQVLIPFTHQEDHFRWAVRTRNRLREKYNVGDYQLLFSNFGRGSDMYLPYNNNQWAEYYRSIGREPPAPKKSNENPLVMRNEVNHQASIGTDIPVSRHPLDFRNHNCYAGIDTLTIDSDGNVWRGWCNQGGKIGSINEMPVAWPKEPIVCAKELCTNGFDQIARKEIIPQL
jgi:organic radical activating enzyme